MIKPQDIVALVKLLACKPNKHWTQNSIAVELCLSPSQVNNSFKRLVTAGLLTPYSPPNKPQPIIQACEEFFLHGLKYIFPAKLGALTRGIATSYAAPSLNDQIVAGSDPIPVWPYGEGDERGLALKPLYPSVPESIAKHPDPLFYDLLTLIDAIRSGRAREKQIAMRKLSEILLQSQPSSIQSHDTKSAAAISLSLSSSAPVCSSTSDSPSHIIRSKAKKNE